MVNLNLVRCTALTLLFLAIDPRLRAEVKLAGMFGDNMILQRESSAPIWGTADPGEKISLAIENQKLTATAKADGTWKAVFNGLKPGGSFKLTVAGKDNTITVNNVAVGDIWVCSGQSNMEYRLAGGGHCVQLRGRDRELSGHPLFFRSQRRGA